MPTLAHGRREQRTRWAIHQPGVLAWIGGTGTPRTPWPQVRQVCRSERQRTPVRPGSATGPTSVEIADFSTSLPPERADAATLLRFQRGHWPIENGLHYVRDVTFDQDRSTVRSDAAPQVMAASRNLAIARLRRSGLRSFAGRPHSAIRLVAFAALPS